MIRIMFAAMLLVGCGKKKDEPAPAPSPAAPPPAAVVVDAAQGSAAGSNQPAAGSAAAVDVPTATDFEDQATKDITDKNVEARVKQMEAELGQ